MDAPAGSTRQNVPVYNGIYAGSAGKEGGFHDGGRASSDRNGFLTSAARFQNGAAGKASGCRYEVVAKGTSTPLMHTSPFATEAQDWHTSTSLFRGPREGPTKEELSADATFGTERNFVVEQHSR
uniref:Uncharacterized protein n=1 Tax=Oxyrrhis marina TaxID=2969 RepID=A0A7S3UK09_OXYMA|mmetsp:Transcript_2676/g.4158  ORF Transcript_2676/g.4158 Transcript_2676/m.4158 type:complete len:125 (+) Transcript_2676:44-418(+)